MITLTTIETAATKDLITFYNANCEKVGKTPVKKFADRKTAEKRVAALLAELPEEKKEKKVKAASPEKAAEARRAGIAKSWQDPVTRVKRSTRNAVIVNGIHYSSCWEAWQALQLGTVNECIKFRGQLKNELKKSLTLNADTYNFEIC
ncbi:Uncharacterised protein [Enterobacter hormaechei]|uniref:hypothetical protein n=1 Tax=Enterobacter hormaechei TaxID=158836 RepID=UPI000798BBBF|nr:hypothetical protein [Enterobacter hormaechei]CZY40764.1 Uncharacterised protein [Enterobacter hormaechei]SAH61202.1 Uncharacterised protein [Enterobacter hormaechei]